MVYTKDEKSVCVRSAKKLLQRSLLILIRFPTPIYYLNPNNPGLNSGRQHTIAATGRLMSLAYVYAS